MTDTQLLEAYERKVRVRDAHAGRGGHGPSYTCAVNELSMYTPELDRRTDPRGGDE